MTITGEWWNQNKRPMLKGVASEVDNLELSTGVVQAKNLSTGANLRAYNFAVGAAVSSAGGLSSGTYVMRAPYRMQYHRIDLFFPTNWQNATDDDVTIFSETEFGNPLSSVGSYTLLTTSVTGGWTMITPSCTAWEVYACGMMAVKVRASTCSVPAPFMGTLWYFNATS